MVCCCTTAREPLFDGEAVDREAVVVAIGSHEPEAREVDERLAGRATVVVESRESALREAGDVIQAIAADALHEDELVPLAALVRGDAAPSRAARGCSRAPAWPGRTSCSRPPCTPVVP